jgi:bisphosphoglycerate-independent phosphoglycerate mutase (AlkP superfamily)
VASFQSDDTLGLRHGAKVLDGSLADVAPTVLSILGLAQPKEMAGHSLISSLILNR